MKKIVIFASGNGTNAGNIIRYGQEKGIYKVSLVASNKPDAFVLKRAGNLGIPTFVFNRQEFYETNTILRLLNRFSPDLIVLAGFLWLIPENIVEAWQGKIINIHPALLPKYGGKGMYGKYVHQAVKENHETESGITIHHVDKKFDTGQIIFQEKCSVSPTDTPEEIADKVHQLEYKYFPSVIEKILFP
ncbi:MAG: phosphoribosylglycinamide formyltransferase [Candidatus Zixiibacteriota bacterium]|nr:MAG: phosphoribosylglycinamide formyltransferase [candidate division Zixibacteria bacterium]